MSKSISHAIAGLAKAITAPLKPYRRKITRALICEQMVQTLPVDLNGHRLMFQATTARALHDVLHFGTDEPETVRWIDHLAPGTLWDVGANVGLYSLYAAARGHTVIAFEPSAASFAALVKNIQLNNMSDRIFPYCVALGRDTRSNTLWLSSDAAGHSMHAIGERGERKSSQPIQVYAATDFQQAFSIPTPDYLKIDVDGTEAEVLQGTASMTSIKSVLVEAETDEADKRISGVLEPRGFGKNDAINALYTRNLVYNLII